MYEDDLISWKIVMVAMFLALVFVGVLDSIH